jgi:RHS repeat-associated protein
LLTAETHWRNHEASGEQSSGRSLDNWHRTYDPGTGRYLTADPIGQAGDVNLYSYALGNPVTRADPAGLHSSRWGVRTARIPFVPYWQGSLNTTLIPPHVYDGPFGQGPGVGCAIAIILRVYPTLPEGMFDKLKHCLLSCEIASTCGVNAAQLAGIAKEIIDMSGLGTPSLEDLVADYSGIACARQGGDASCPQDCRRCCSARWGQP